MVVGKMRESVVFLQNTPVAKGAGYIDSYTNLLTTRGQLIDNSGSRSLSFGAVADSGSWRLICRFQTALANSLRSDTKVVINTITYTINGRPKLVDQKKHIYEFSLSSQQN